MSAPGRQLICLTPVANEAWILDRFLACASLWANHIILADHGSTDETRAIASRYSKVRLIANSDPSFSEARRQQLLLAAGREIPGEKIFFALDADECLSGTFFQSPDWDRVLNAPRGSLFHGALINLLPGLQHAWLAPLKHVIFVDDGTPHVGRNIHSPRLPLSPAVSAQTLNGLAVLHYQYTDWTRMESKHAWYQCYEILRTDWHPVELYRKYHHMYRFAKRPSLTVPFDPEWVSMYEKQGISMRTTRRTPYWWDAETVHMMLEHGCARFANAAIWDRDWNAVGASCAPDSTADFSDPRRMAQKWLHRYLRWTRAYPECRPVRWMDAMLRLKGW